MTIILGLRHQAGSQSRARFATATLELSYAGDHWTELELRKVADGTYTTTTNHPHTQAGKTPSLRLTATDANGNKIEHAVANAYDLSPGRAGHRPDRFSAGQTIAPAVGATGRCPRVAATEEASMDEHSATPAMDRRGLLRLGLATAC